MQSGRRDHAVATKKGRYEYRGIKSCDYKALMQFMPKGPYNSTL
jgi:hypothetical protein